MDQASAARTIAELKVEISILLRLEELAQQVRRSGTDRKWESLATLLQNRAEMFDANGYRRKLVIFTEHRDTLNYLVGRIGTLLGGEEAVVMIHGAMSREERAHAQHAFTQLTPVQVLVATDAAGEGINLQRAHLMVNYDLPWNPNRLEQRFGRIHRIGQTEVCHLWNLVANETREGEVFHTLLKKLEEERDALGGQVFDVLGKVLFDSIPLWRGNHVKIQELTENFAKYVYLPRLKNTEVLLSAMRDGLQSMVWSSETFAYADSWDEEGQRYRGLKAGQQVQVAVNAESLLVKPEIASAQLVADSVEVQASPPAASVEVRTTTATPAQATVSPLVANGNMPHIRETAAKSIQAEPTYQRFHGSVKINPRKMGTEASTLMEEVVKHLTSLSKDGVTVTIEIQADIPGGVPADTMRAITENCHTLHFDSYDFEED